MRLTALLPPPPTPTTLILAESKGEKEQEMRPRRGLVVVVQVGGHLSLETGGAVALW